jgi:hypothetical protein
LARFNGGKPLKKSLINKIEKFMDHKWKNDQILALTEEDDLKHYNQLPEKVQTKLIQNFLFSAFLSKFQ